MNWEKVDGMDWESLTDAYGGADYVPQMLRGLASGDAGDQDMAWEMLYGGLFHQGSIYPATVAALPFLMQLLALPDFSQVERLLLFLAQIGAQTENIPYYEEYIREGKAWAERELADTRRAIALLPEGHESYQYHLQEGDPETQEAALTVMAWCGQRAVDPILGFIEGVDDPSLLTTAYLALGCAAESSLDFFARGREHYSTQVRLAACLGWIMAAEGDVSEDILREVRDILNGSNAYRLLARRMAGWHDALGTPDAYLQPLKWPQIKFLVDSLAEDPLAWSMATLKEEAEAAMNLAEYYLTHVFSETAFVENTSLKTLDRLEVDFLTALAKSDAAWIYDGNMSSILRDCGIRFCHDRTSLMAFLNQPELTRVMVFDPSWSPEAQALCIEMGREKWQEMPFIFYEGSTDILDSLIPEDPADFPPELMANARKLASKLFHKVVKPAAPSLSHYRFYEGKTIDQMLEIARSQGWEIIDPPEKLKTQSQPEAQTAVGEDLSHQAALRLDDLAVWQRADLELFVKTLDDAGWLEAKHWHDQHFKLQAAQVPIGFGRFINERAFLELQIWFYDDAVAAMSGKRTGMHYLRFAIVDREEETQMVFRLYYQQNLDQVLRRILFHQREIYPEKVMEQVIQPLLKYLYLEKAILDMGDLQLVALSEQAE